LGFLGLGMWPDKTRDELPIMPKGRYDIMLRHMPRVGSMGLDMMLRTCTIQTNLDYSSEADMVKKFRVSLALQPLATALFANSPFTEGKPNGFLSYRSHIWTDTDPAPHRHAALRVRDGFGYERYADYMLDVPMYFRLSRRQIHRRRRASFRDFLKGKLSVLPGEKPRRVGLGRSSFHRVPRSALKASSKCAGADGGPWNRICALPALWVGLLYDQTALDAAWDLVKDWDMEGREKLRAEVPKLGSTHRLPGGGTLRDIAAEVLAISRSGLNARGRLNDAGDNETGYPQSARRDCPLPARFRPNVLLDKFHGEWGGDLSRIYEGSF
jgi:glutamate--cysteine ligase